MQMMLDKIIYPEKAFYYFKQRYHDFQKCAMFVQIQT